MKSYITLLSFLFLSSFSFAQKHVANELIIQSNIPLDSYLNSQIERSTAYVFESIFKAENIYKITYSTNINLDVELTKWRDTKGVRYAMKNFIAESRNRPNDALFSDQIAFEIMNLESAWDLSTGGFTRDGKEIVVAVIDAGYDLSHEDFVDNIWSNSGEIPNDNIDNDNNGYVDDIQGIDAGSDSDDHPLSAHGNSVFGTIGAKGDNDLGVSGINWDIKVMPISSNGTVAQILESYSYILELRRKYNTSNGAEGAFVVATNASFGINSAVAEDYPIWCEMYNTLGAEGILSVGATSNDVINVDVDGDMPTTCTSPYLIAVTTTDENDIISAGYGSTHIDIVAPGDEGFTSSTNNNYRKFTGTSSAAPMVAGAIGLIYSLDSDIINSRCSPSVLALTVKDIILRSVRRSATFESNTVSGGILDVNAACRYILALDASSGDKDELLSICSFTSGPLTSTVITTISNPENVSYEVIIYNESGQLIKVIERADTDCYKIDVSSISSGVYFLSVISEKSKLSKKFFKL